MTFSSRIHRTSTVIASSTCLIGVLACGPGADDAGGDGDGDVNGDGDVGTGGSAGDSGGSSSGGSNSGGSSSGGSGAGGTGSGGDGSGGDGSGGDPGGTGGGAASVCPSGSESMVLDLTGKTPSAAVSGVPPAGYSGSFNLEGPVWIGDALYASEIADYPSPNPARIIRYVPGGAATVFLETAGTNGLAVNSDGDLVVARQSDGSISVIDIDAPDSAATVLTGMYMGARYNSPNDLTISSTGHLYFTDPDWQAPMTKPQAAERAYHLPPGGQPAEISGAPNKPNGVTLSLDEQYLYITGSEGLQRYPVMGDGTVGAGTPVSEFYGGGDGMGMDCAGNLFVTNGQQIVVIDNSGTVVDNIQVGASVTNIAFGGPNRTTMFITSLQPAALRTIEMDIPGLPY